MTSGAQQHSGRNPGCEFNLDALEEIRLNRFAAEQRVATLTQRRSVKGEAQTAWLAKAVTCIDLTTLAGDDTAGRVRRLCTKASHPIRPDLIRAVGLDPAQIQCGAVCVYHRQVRKAVAALSDSGVPVAAVSTGFPAGQTPHALKVREIRESVRAGATEIDVVITREYVLAGQWRRLFAEVQDFRAAADAAKVKVILGTGDLRTMRNVAKASQVAMMAGADFIKTSTGKEDVNATLLVSLVMARAIRDYYERTGYRVGFKPAGGVSTAKVALHYQVLMLEELGRAWLDPDLFRIGASSLLGDIERQFEHRVTGLYSANNRHPIS